MEVKNVEIVKAKLKDRQMCGFCRRKFTAYEKIIEIEQFGKEYYHPHCVIAVSRAIRKNNLALRNGKLKSETLMIG